MKGAHVTESAGRHEITMKRVRYECPGTERVTVRKNVEYTAADDDGQSLDIYYPPDWSGAASTPAVIFVSGLSDIGAQQFLGCRINEMESFISWARLAAASGLIGITYTTGPDPAADTRTALQYLHARGGGLGIDTPRLALWACSSHVPNALGQLIEHPQSFRCAVFCYGFMLDLDDATGVAEAQGTYRFANPSAGKKIDDLPRNTSLFIARAGQDGIPHVNESIDRFLAHAVQRNLPVTFVNHHNGPHAFDIEDDSDATRAIVRQMLAYLQLQLLSGHNDENARASARQIPEQAESRSTAARGRFRRELQLGACPSNRF